MHRWNKPSWMKIVWLAGFAAATLLVVGDKLPLSAAKPDVDKVSDSLPGSSETAAEVDRLIDGELRKAEIKPAPRTNDEDFLRRVMLDLTGAIPTAAEVTLFGLDPDPDKRVQLVDRLLESDEYAQNWARYWRDVIYSRATDQRTRINQGTFETWMAAHLKENSGWDQVATELLTATGDVREKGATALVFAHSGQPAEVAAEASRIFLGIQIQCANCHDHPTDKWKRKQFHEMAAFFPRIQVRRTRDPAQLKKAGLKKNQAKQTKATKTRKKGGKKKRNKKAKTIRVSAAKAVDSKKTAPAKPKAKKKKKVQRSFEVVSYSATKGNSRREQFFMNPGSVIRRLDTDGDKQLSKAEVKRTPAARIFDRLLEQGDENKDQKLSVEEIKKIKPPQNFRRGSSEHFMPDLDDPAARGKRMDPVFFINGAAPNKELDDLDRRNKLALYMTSKNNQWFARAYVNRIWGEMLGEGFYMPIDDMGPERTATFPEVLDLLAAGFTANGYDCKWLFRTIARTAAYQRQSITNDSDEDQVPFAAGTPKRLRADQLYAALTHVAGFQGDEPRRENRKAGPARFRSPRAQFGKLFGYDPSTPQEDILGTVPQALFMMNSPIVNRIVRAGKGTRLNKILTENSDDGDAVAELYLLVLGRMPSENELKTALNYCKEVDNRNEAFEDLFWSLLNSSEFLSQR